MIHWLRRVRLSERERWQQEQNAKEAYEVAFSAWETAYQRLRTRLPKDKRLAFDDSLRHVQYSEYSGCLGDPDSRRMHLRQARREVQELIWTLERLGVFSPVNQNIRTPEDALARLMRERE